MKDQPGDLASAETLTDAGQAASGERPTRISLDGIDLRTWGRYERLELLGAGGGGQVFKAWDPRLRRHVALKFLRAEDPDLLAKFVMEAQAQARVDHENVCKVYEVGDLEGRPFIAMQYIEGRTLRLCERDMTLEQKVQVLRDVSLAVHAAHRLGIIHRDLKPSNIMVETTADGAWKPYVLDFGLARQAEARGATATGVVVGTAQYMSPEQARGDVHNIDRRTDVYSLGATLYDTLVGDPPFTGNTMMDVLLKVVYDDPTPPRRKKANIPIDLETIVMKCLEKEPGRRYDTARALAEDLGRWLDGEAVLARRASMVYRLRKKVRKHRALVALSLLAACAIAVLGGSAILARQRAAVEAQLAQELGQDVERIDAVLRYAYLLPLHDTRRERARVRERMDDIRAKMRALGAVAEGPGHYALGRGHLALGEFADARRELETAWRKGWRQPEVASALGRALGALYQKGLEEAARLPSKELREARRAELAKTLRDPALAYLGSGEGGEYARAQLALYEGRSEDAVRLARAALAKSPWLYEARLLVAQVSRARALEKRERGDYAGALADEEQAGGELGSAAAEARSDPAVHLAECARQMNVAEIDLKTGRSWHSAFDGASAACDRAATADPDGAAAPSLLARLYWLRGDAEAGSGADPRPSLERSIELAQRASERDPRDALAHNAAGNALESMGEWESQHGGDAKTTLERSAAEFRRALEIDPRSTLGWNSLGNAFEARAEHEETHGGDAAPWLDRAAEAFQKATALNDRFVSGWNNLGNVYLMRKDCPRAVEAYRRALSLNPSFAVTWNNLGMCQAQTGDLAQSIASFRKATEINPRYANAWSNLAAVLKSHGDLGEARQAARRTLEINPADPDAKKLLAELNRPGRN